MMIQPWRIEMFGGLRAVRGAEILSRFKSQKVAALLAYLAFHASQAHSREELVELLWPNDELEAARNRLRVALSTLRHQLEPPGIAAGSVLIADRTTIQMHPEAYTTDVQAFSNAFNEALRVDEEEREGHLLTAVEAYRGDLLPGFTEEWILGERERLSQSYLQALHRLVRCLVRKQEYERALAYALRATQSDPLREEAWRDVMRLHVALGQPSAALQQYAELERVLKEGVGARPSGSTQQLAEQIQQGLGHGVGARASVATAVKEPSPPEEKPPAKLPLPAPSETLRGYLPVSLTRFFGREEELKRLCSLLSPEDDAERRGRLVTLIGPGGMGKSRLALEAARRLRSAYRDRVWHVNVADLVDPNRIVETIAGVMELPYHPQKRPIAQILEALSGKPSLLILDCFEHLTDHGAPLLAALLEELPDLTCLLTSRRTLGIAGEQELMLPPLPLPELSPPYSPGMESVAPWSEEALACLWNCASVRLFLDRAQAVLPEFQLTPRNASEVVLLCRELEGIPLAIELAATRARVLTPAQMREHLAHRFDLLVNRRADKDIRHRSLRATLEWSYHLLAPELRRLFARLSVFRGGWSLRAAQEVCAEPDTLETLEQLRIESLVLATEVGGEMRFRMLETIREFASELLPENERALLAQQHADYFVMFAEEAAPYLVGADVVHWMGILDMERDNLRTAFDWCCRSEQPGKTGFRLMNALWRYWVCRGYFAEGRERYAAILQHTQAQPPSVERARAFVSAGLLAFHQDDYTGARTLFEEAVRLSEQIEDQASIVYARSNLGTALLRQGELHQARAIYEQHVAFHRAANAKVAVASDLNNLGVVACMLGDYAVARSCFEESLQIHRTTGDRWYIATTTGNLGQVAEELGEYAEAQKWHEESLAIHREMNNRSGIGMALGNLGTLALRQGEFQKGIPLVQEALTLFRELGQKRNIAIALGNLGCVEECLGNVAQAIEIQKECLQLQREAGYKIGVGIGLSSLARLHLHQKDLSAARPYLAEALELVQIPDMRELTGVVLSAFVEAASLSGNLEQAAQLCAVVERFQQDTDAVLSTGDRKLLEPGCRQIRAALSQTDYAAAYAQGQALSTEQALKLASTLVPPDPSRRRRPPPFFLGKGAKH